VFIKSKRENFLSQLDLRQNIFFFYILRQVLNTISSYIDAQCELYVISLGLLLSYSYCYL